MCVSIKLIFLPFFFQGNTHLVKHIITSEWIQPQELKHLFASFHNIGVFLYRSKQVKEVFFLPLAEHVLLVFLFLIVSCGCNWLLP